MLHHAAHPLDDRTESFGRRQTVHRALRQLALDLLLQARHAHLEELIQIRADDAEELHSLQQRVLRVERFLQHPVIELQPAQFPIDEMSRPESNRFGFGFHYGHQGSRPPVVWKVTKRRWRGRATASDKVLANHGRSRRQESLTSPAAQTRAFLERAFLPVSGFWFRVSDMHPTTLESCLSRSAPVPGRSNIRW